MEQPQIGDFADLDSSSDGSVLVAWMQRQRVGSSARHPALLAGRPGERVADLGCGPGADLGYFRRKAAGNGVAVGVDRSIQMSVVALREGLAVVGDMAMVPLRGSFFDAVWVRAVLVHLPEPRRAMEEAWRLLKPGGRIVVLEPDHGSHLVGPCDVEVFERIRAHRYRGFQNPRIGRHVPDLLAAAGFVDLAAEFVSTSVTDLESARAGGGPFDRAVADAVADGVISEQEGSAYLTSLTQASERGSFLFHAGSVVASGVRPACTRRTRRVIEPWADEDDTRSL